MKELAYKSFGVEVKEQGEDGKLHVKFYALAFNNVDSWGDIIVPTACDAFMASENKDRMKLCYQHDTRQVIGVLTDMKVDEYGLLCEGDILPTALGKDVQTLLKAGAVNEFSIGYYPDEYHYEKREGYSEDIRILDAITIVEVSPVTRAANPKAVLLDAKSEDFQGAMKEMSDAQLETLYQEVENEYYRRFFGYIG